MKSIFVVVLLALAQHTRATTTIDTTTIDMFSCNDYVNYVDDTFKATIPNTITTIDVSAFVMCNVITSLTFDSGSILETIGNYAFQGAEITSVTIPTSVTSIGDYAFAADSSSSATLESLTFDSGSKLKTIGAYAFQYTKLTAVSIPPTVTQIGNNAFPSGVAISYACKSAKTLSIKTCDTIGSSYNADNDNNDAGVDGADFQSNCCASSTCVGWKDHKTCNAGTSYSIDFGDVDAGENGNYFQNACCDDDNTCVGWKDHKTCEQGTSYNANNDNNGAGNNGVDFQSVCCESCISVNTDGDVNYCNAITITNEGLQNLKSALDDAVEDGLALQESCALE